jgi:GNAT superfamily N-acetyltransferase
MDGNTWRRYRFIVDRGTEPSFLLEPDNPDDWPRHWSLAGFSQGATYSSALNDDLSVEDPRTATSLTRLRAEGISIRTLDPILIESELRRIFALTTVAFRRNLLYTPIPDAEFLAQYRALLPYLRPELILLAERGDALVGFMFAIPDLLQVQRGVALDTVILKTIAVDPSVSGMGLGGVLMDLVQRAARQMGFRRAIHALFHEMNESRRISARYARTIRRYALFARPLQGSPPIKSARGAEWATGPTERSEPDGVQGAPPIKK